jgi:hypothetical protein
VWLKSRRDVKALGAVPKPKKRHVQRETRLPTKVSGNCLLGFHCSQNDLAGTRAVACFPVVAGRQQEKDINRFSTACHVK